jgi:hypothetical protein
MCFKSIALPYARMGFPVFPLVPREKIPAAFMKDWPAAATTDEAQIVAWDAQDPSFNCGLVAKNDGFVILEFDVQGGMRQAAAEMGEAVPKTRVHISGKQRGHFIFRNTDRSRSLGNCNARLPEGGEWFSFRQHNMYVVGPGSIHPNGKPYKVAVDGDLDPIPCPDWVIEFVEKHSNHNKNQICGTRQESKTAGSVSVSPDFDFDDFCRHYSDVFGVINVCGSWHITDICPATWEGPGTGRRHEHSTSTGFYWDGTTFGFHCFAGGCEGSSMTAGDVIRDMNQNHEPYPEHVWGSGRTDEELMAGFGIEMDGEEPTATQENKIEISVSQLRGLIDTGKGLPDPLDFPVDCMYGKAGELATEIGVSLGIDYPAILTVCCGLKPCDTRGNVRGTLYTANIAGIGTGKTVSMQRAVDSIMVPEGCTMRTVTGSDRGVLKALGSTGTTTVLLQDEFRNLMSKMATPGSGISLASILCELWSSDNASASDKRGVDECDVRLSILGNLPCDTPADFTSIFGSQTTKGLADRFVLGWTRDVYDFQPVDIKKQFIDVRPCTIPNWAFERKRDWALGHAGRRRLGEIALRVALITAVMNDDLELKEDCLEKALLFAEWQERIRDIYKPGMAENKEAECFEAIVWLLHQHGTGVDIHWAKTINSKGYYRRFGSTLINRVKDSMVKEGIISVEYATEIDDHGRERQTKRPTGIVTLKGRIR